VQKHFFFDKKFLTLLKKNHKSPFIIFNLIFLTFGENKK
jgi:hypothetical protein